MSLLVWKLYEAKGQDLAVKSFPIERSAQTLLSEGSFYSDVASYQGTGDTSPAEREAGPTTINTKMKVCQSFYR